MKLQLKKGADREQVVSGNGAHHSGGTTRHQTQHTLR